MRAVIFGLFWFPFSRTVANLAMLIGGIAMLASNFVPVQKTRGGARTALLIAAAAFACAALIGGGTILRLSAVVLSLSNVVLWARTRPSEE